MWDVRERQEPRVTAKLPSLMVIRDVPHSWDRSSLNSGAPPTLLCLSPPSLAIPSRFLGSLTSWLWPSITEISQDPFPGPLLSEASLHPGDIIPSSHALPQAADSQACIGPCSPRSSRPTSPNASQASLLGRLKTTSNSTGTNLNSRGAPTLPGPTPHLVTVALTRFSPS